MSLNNNIKSLLGEYSVKRLEAEKRADEEIERIHKMFPRIEEIKCEIDKLGLEATRMVIRNPRKKDEIKLEMEEKIKILSKEKEQICIENNIPLDFGRVKYECEICKDHGILEEGGKCRCLEQKIIETCYDRTNMKNLLEKQNFYTLDENLYSDKENSGGGGITQRELMKNHIRIARKFIDNIDTSEGKNLVFQGQTGTGKTFLSSCIAKEVIDKGMTVVYKSSVDIIKLVSKMQFGSDYGQEVTEEYESIMNCDLLIIDDLGTEMISKFVVSELYYLINTRIVSGKKFIISTNLSTKEIDQLYTSRIAYRLAENCSILPFVGDNLRKKKLFG